LYKNTFENEIGQISFKNQLFEIGE